MSLLLLYIGEGRAFDAGLVKRFLQQCSGVSDLQEGAMDGAYLHAHYSFEGDSTIVELKQDSETVVLSGAGPASVQMGYLLQSAYPEPLHVIDEGYSFDLVIRDFESAQQLAGAIYAAMNNR